MSFLITLSLLMIFAIATFFRMYRRTGLTGYLLLSWGGVIAAIGIVGTFGCMYMGHDRLSDLFGYTFMIPGLVLGIIGEIILLTIESGAVREAYSGHSILDIILGDISPLEADKTYKPALGRNMGLLVGFMGVVGGIAQYMDDESKMPFGGGYLILFGLAIFIVSLVALQEKNKEAERIETGTALERKKIESARGRIVGIVLGIIGIIAGAHKCYNSYPSISYSGIFLIVLGLAAFIAVSMASKGNRH